MTPLLVLSDRPLAGRTAVTLGLAEALRRSGARVAVARLGGDAGAERDARLFARLGLAPSGRETPLSDAEIPAIADGGALIVECPPGPAPSGWQEWGARALAVARYPDLGLGPEHRALGEALLGVVVTCVPRRRLERVRAEAAGASPLLALVEEDRFLASPTLGQMAEALGADCLFSSGREEMVLDRIFISPISADPGQGYFVRHRPTAVIVRSDKPDLQLGAFNAGVPCLIVTGTVPVLPYVLQRAEEEMTPMLLTPMGTVEVAQRLDDLIGQVPLQGRAKAERAAEVVGRALSGPALERLLTSA
ncbi:MAG TPA: DRTGG domain-containing protein [Dehalococcoidia bacterium]|nr:DRTGG domain-containing protein [Dehalococcoidia bacterium]